MDATSVTGTPILSVHETDRRTPRAELVRLSQAVERHPEVATDPRAATTLLEESVCVTLGKQAALFMPTGKMAQQIALRVHADQAEGGRAFVGHPTNHLSLWEDENYAVLHEMHARLVGDRNELMTADNLRAGIGADVAAVMWELPQRELGGELPSWTDLQTQLATAGAAGVATHLDGARVWQTPPFYDRPLDEICAGFDSVYVSLYKDLEAPRGAVLVGDENFIAGARRWRHRLGGTIDEAWPLALLALDGMERAASAMPAYMAHAQAVAAAITERTPATVRPNPPHTAMFHLHLPIGPAAALHAHRQLVDEGGPRLGLRIRTSPNPAHCSIECSFGEASLALDPTLIADAVNRLIKLAGP
ncbi:beta-eliminating lyase-related protein [Rhodococcus sp. IEGM 1381]|uniref:threonine aldolase family protein n=1 Tax=Rhodococcus sp. IEGM 1381 TaxID=3047085 RepID=UPI0024B71208|nr:beta-eliminating lyase-related protein [Rhodococcus sp. IEGM 1381]MDI9893334.1 beta-eliminating lyase-related protein [Rhodococcus sp. IEGM 1381]